MDDASDNFLRDFDPDYNYYDQIIDQNNLFTSYNSVSDFLSNNPVSNNDKNFMTIFSQNIRSMNRNLDSFLSMFPSNNMPDVFIFSETWHDTNTPVNIPGYTGFHTVRSGRAGGVSVFYKSNLPACHVPEFSFANENIEVCSIKLSNSMHICGVYRPHSGTIDDFCLQLEAIVNHSSLSNTVCVFAGDFNINLFSEADDVCRFVDMMRSHHYIQTITDITRPNIDRASSTLIDHVWVNQLTNYYCGILKTGITDHHTLFMQIPFNSDKANSTKIKITFRDCSAPNQQSFEDNLLNFDWETVKSNDANQYATDFVYQVNEIYRNSFPLKTKYVTIKYFKNPWHTKQIRKLADYRTKYHGLLSKGLVSQANFAKFRNKITALIRKAKETYYNKIFLRNMSNVRATWKLINKICTNSQKKPIKKITLNNLSYDDPKDLVELFNNFFVNIAEELAQNLPNSTESPYSYVHHNLNNLLILSTVTAEECSTIISSLKNTKQDIHHISVEMFKKFHHFFLPVICNIINLCFDSGIFPDCFKHATVIPIFKKGDSCNMSNYRPIALLPFMSKIIERCIYNRISEFATTCNILSPNQFGFRKGKSTQDAILLLTEQIYNSFNEGDGSFCINIFIDFQKCFDTIDHDILIGKLALYGINGTALDLIRSYLSNRTQSVRISDITSSPQSIGRGVPQGSILGPLLFLFFINDLPNISNKSVPILFADDTTLSFNCSTINEANFVCSSKLDNFFKWSTANKLSVNKSKTYFIYHTFCQLDESSIKITMNDHALEKFDEGMFLGVMIDRKLNFCSHIDYISAKISKSIGIIYKLNSLKIPKSVLKQVYFSLIHSHLNYNISSYAGTYPTHLNRLVLLQKRAIRIINNESYLAHTNSLFLSNRILKFQDMYKLNLGMYIYDRSSQYNRSHEHYTRNRNDLLPAQSRLTVTENYISAIGPTNFNSIPAEIRAKPSRQSFKYHYKQYLLSQYNNLGL